MVSKKVILIGKFGVGKSSLVRRFVFQKFSEDYITTIGVKIDKKVIDINGVEMNMLIWDIAGESSQAKIPSSYKLGSHGILYVFDLTRPSTYEQLHEEIKGIREVLPKASMRILANKSDLVSLEEKEKILKELDLDIINYSSAKTGENVENTFYFLANDMLINH